MAAMSHPGCRAAVASTPRVPGAGPANGARPGKAGLREGDCAPRRAGLGAGPRPFRRPLPEPRSGGGGRARDTAWPCAAAAGPVLSRPVSSWRWSGRAPAPPAARSGLPRPRLFSVRRSRRGCERGRGRRNLTLKYLRSECLWILEQNWEFIWKK